MLQDQTFNNRKQLFYNDVAASCGMLLLVPPRSSRQSIWQLLVFRELRVDALGNFSVNMAVLLRAVWSVPPGAAAVSLKTVECLRPEDVAMCVFK